MAVFVAILIFGNAWLYWTRPDAGGSDTAAGPAVATAAAAAAAGPAVGRMAPDFTLPTLDGGSFQLSAQRGKPVVLNFWATWCGPCQRELPAVQRTAELLGDNVVFAAVDQNEDANVVQRYVDKLGLTFAIPMDAGGEIGYLYNVQGLPTTFFIDRNGVIQSLWLGEMDSMTLAQHIAGIE
jgi:thiol-disulfide isomerase/thioredoxin